MRSRQWLINGNPRGRAIELGDFAEASVELGALEPRRVRVRTDWLSFDPAQKAQLENVSGYASGNELGNVMVGRGVGTVVESRADQFPVGATVMGPLGWQEVADHAPAALTLLPDAESARAYLGVLGTTGLTAYFGLLDVGRPEPGDTVVVSGAAGAVGSIVGQIAKIAGARVIGIAGGAAKCEWLIEELGFDAAIDYKAERTKHRLRELCPGGVDVFFDNVGGSALNDVLACVATGARVVVCGGIARYNDARPTGPANYFNIVFRQATMQGFLLKGYEHRYPVAQARLRQWLEDGALLVREDIQRGFDNIPATLLRLFSGANIGKQLLRL
ncbi:MAG: NADP-dependent oxidoreductase [Pseudomonadota bacterium]